MIRDTFDRANQPLNGSVMDSGHTWTTQLNNTAYTNIVSNQLRVTGPPGVYDTIHPDFDPDGSGGIVSPLTQENVVSVSVDLASDKANGTLAWIQPLITVTGWQVLAGMTYE